MQTEAETIEQPKAKTEQTGARMGHRVTIKPVKGHPIYKWRASYIDGGKYRQKGFKTKSAAETWAEEHEEETLEHGTGANLTAVERSSVIDTRNQLEALGIDLRAAVNRGIEYYERAHKSITVEKLIDKVISAKDRAGKSTKHIRDLSQKLGRFGESFGNRSVATIDADELDEWLHGLQLTPNSTNAYRRILNLFFNVAKKRKFIAENPLLAVERITEQESEIVVLTLEETTDLLNHADARILPAIAIAAFAGLRSSEIEGTHDYKGLNWREIDFEEGTILVRADKTKGRAKRHVPMSDNLRSWLMPQAKPEGQVWPRNGRKLHEAARRAAGFGEEGTGVESKPWPRNAMRHSYASYFLAEHSNAAELVLNMGHRDDAETVFGHYRQTVKPTQAAAFWAIAPEEAKNVIAIKKAS